MKKRSLVVGLGIVLALSLAVPAVGSGGLAKVLSIAKKALSTSKSAKSAAASAGSAAAAAQTAAEAAVSAAAAAKRAADQANGNAAAAKSKADAASDAAGAALTTALGAKSTANEAITEVAKKASHTIVSSELLVGVSGAQRLVKACPEGKISGGGYALGGDLPQNVTVKESEPEGNGWALTTQPINGGGSYNVRIWVVCLVP
jgi:hypothetical protein